MYLSKGSGAIIILVGNVGQDPHISSVSNTSGQGERCGAFFSLAVDDSYTDRNGQKVERTTWVECKAFGKQAEAIRDYVKKGRKLEIFGRPVNRTRTLVDPKDGQQKQFNFLQIEVVEWTFLDKAPEGQHQGHQPQHQQGQHQQGQHQQGQYQQPQYQQPQYQQPQYQQPQYQQPQYPQYHQQNR